MRSLTLFRGVRALTLPAITLLAIAWAGNVLGQENPETKAPVATPAPALAPASAPKIFADPLLVPPPKPPQVLKSWDEALSIIRQQSPEFLRAYDNILRAEGQSRVALAGILPSAVAQGSFTHQFFTTRQMLGDEEITIPAQDVFNAGGTVTVPVVNPRAWHAIGTANRAVDAAKRDVADKRRTLAQALVSAMLATLAAERAAELNRVGLQAALERLALAQTRARVQLGTELDFERAQQDADTARATVISGDEALRRSREALGVALGSSTATAAPGTLDLATFEASVASTCRLNSQIEQRADVGAARMRVEVADRAVTDVSLQFAPTVAVQSQLLWGSQVLYGPQTIWAVQGVVSVPIWDGGVRYGQLRDARATADQAKQTLALARLNALVDIAQATRAVSVSAEARDVARRQRERAVRIDRSTRESFRLGIATSLELVTSAQALRVAELNVVGLEYQAAQARIFAILSNAECVY